MKKIIVFIEGGVVQTVESNDENIDVIIIDRDVESADDIENKKMIENDLKDGVFKKANVKYYVSNEEICYNYKD